VLAELNGGRKEALDRLLPLVYHGLRGAGRFPADRETGVGGRVSLAARRTHTDGACMTPERWAQVKELFNSAHQKPAHERDAFLDRAGGEDASLREQVKYLLAHEGPVSLQSGISVRARIV